MPLKALANINVQDPKTLVVVVQDSSLTGVIEKAIRDSKVTFKNDEQLVGIQSC